MALHVVPILAVAGAAWVVNDLLDFSGDVMEFFDDGPQQANQGVDWKAVAVLGLAAAGGFYLATKVVK